MNLTAHELEWLNRRMDWYDIKYQEIYDEIADHIILAIGRERSAGDRRTIDIVFDMVAHREFGGYSGIEKIVKDYERAYRRRIRIALWKNLKSYINFQTMAWAGILTFIGLYLPHNKQTAIVMFIGLSVTAFVPFVFASRNAPQLKTDAGKQSIVKSFMKTRALALVLLLNFVVNVFGFLAEQWHFEYLKFKNYPPVVYMVLFSFFIIYGLSTIRLCRQEFKIAA